MQELPQTVPTVARPWHREPLVWLIVAIPALTVVAGLSTVLIAYHGSDTVVADEFRADGLAINRDPARDRAAAAAGATALVDGDAAGLAVRLELARASPPRRLVLVLSHATRADLDRMLTLERDADGRYHATLGALPPGHWYLEIGPVDRSWRLTGDFNGLPHGLSLRPRPAG